MTTMPTTKTMLLNGLDGSNPLAFLAGLGALRTLTMMHPKINFRMNWTLDDGAWRPVLSSTEFDFDDADLCDNMAEWLAEPPQMKLFEEIGDDLTISPKRFRHLTRANFENTSSGDNTANTALNFLASFGSDATFQPHSKDHSLIQDTALRTMSGAGHQHFIKFMREIIVNTTSSHLHSTLFADWKYEDEGRGLNLRWNPIDDRRYAMRWKNPSSDAAMSMRGANRLAIEALPLFATAPMKTTLQTTGFRTVSRKGTFWSWPIWDRPVSLQPIYSILQFPGVTDNKTEESLVKRGIVTTFTSQRITVGKFRNFTPSKPLST